MLQKIGNLIVERRFLIERYRYIFRIENRAYDSVGKLSERGSSVGGCELLRRVFAR